MTGSVAEAEAAARRACMSAGLPSNISQYLPQPGPTVDGGEGGVGDANRVTHGDSGGGDFYGFNQVSCGSGVYSGYGAGEVLHDEGCGSGGVGPLCGSSGEGGSRGGGGGGGGGEQKLVALAEVGEEALLCSPPPPFLSPTRLHGRPTAFSTRMAIQRAEKCVRTATTCSPPPSRALVRPPRGPAATLRVCCRPQVAPEADQRRRWEDPVDVGAVAPSDSAQEFVGPTAQWQAASHRATCRDAAPAASRSASAPPSAPVVSRRVDGSDQRASVPGHGAVGGGCER